MLFLIKLSDFNFFVDTGLDQFSLSWNIRNGNHEISGKDNINFNIKILNELFFKTILIFFVLLNLFKNYDNLDTIKYNSFVRNYDYSKFENIYSSNDYKVFKPTINNFCNFFNGFCTYQGYKVNINKKNGFYFIKRDK